MAVYFGNTEALGKLLAPGGFNPRLPPGLPGFVEFGDATFRAGASEAEKPRHESGLLGSLVYWPMVFRRNDVASLAACAWRAGAKADDITALKRAKRELDRRLIDGAAELVAGLVHQLRGDRAAEAFTSVPCGHSRRARSDRPSPRSSRMRLMARCCPGSSERAPSSPTCQPNGTMPPRYRRRLR